MSSFISPSMEYQVEELLQWAMTHSIVMALPPASDAIITHAPLTLKPYPFLSSQFQQAVSLAEHFNELVDLISLDSDWLLQTLRLTAENDFFTGKLVQIFKIVNAEGIKQPLRLGLNIAVIVPSCKNFSLYEKVSIAPIICNIALLETLDHYCKLRLIPLHHHLVASARKFTKCINLYFQVHYRGNSQRTKPYRRLLQF